MTASYHRVAVTTAVFACWLGVASAQILQDNGSSCRLVTLIPFTDTRKSPLEARQRPELDYLQYGDASWPNQEKLAKAAFSLMAAAEMARIHFNERNAAIVPEMSNDDLKECPIQIPEDSIYLDSGYSRAVTANELLQLVRSRESTAFCSIIGPVTGHAVEGVSLVAGSLGIPQLGYATIDRSLSEDEDEFPSFRRIIPDGMDIANAVGEYIQRDIWQRDTVGLLYDDSDFGELFEHSLMGASDQYDLRVIAGHMVTGHDTSVESSLEQIVEKGYRTVIVATDRPAVLHTISRLADELGMLDGQYFWVFAGEALPAPMQPFYRFEVDSAMDKLLRGAAVFTKSDRFFYEGNFNSFLTAWRGQDVALVDHLNAIQPKATNGESLFIADSSYFQTEAPAEYASFIYDAVMTAGISACKASLRSRTGRGNHVQQVLTTEFNGASGPLSFYDSITKSFRNSRNIDGVLLGMYNLRPGDVDDQNMRGYQRVLASVYSHDNEFSFINEKGDNIQGNGAWTNVGAVQFLFSDGSPDEPLPKQAVANANYLSKSIQRLGLSLAAIAMAICLLSALWVFYFRDSRLVKASQPVFIYSLCFGGFLVSSSIVFLSFDEGKDVNEKQLTSFCRVFPWFFFLGYLMMYCSLFSKLWRLSQLLQMRRHAFAVQQVLLPFLIVIASSMIILILWQTVDPLVWEVTVINTEPLETYGECRSENITNFLIPLFMVFFVMMFMTAMISWKLKDVQSDLAESRWVFAAIMCHIQIFAVGLPIINIVDGQSKDAEYAMSAALTFIVSTSMVTLVVWPRMFVWARDKYLGGPPPKPVVVTLNDVGTTRVSGLSPSGVFSNKSSVEESAVEKSRNPPQMAVLAALDHARHSARNGSSAAPAASDIELENSNDDESNDCHQHSRPQDVDSVEQPSKPPQFAVLAAFDDAVRSVRASSNEGASSPEPDGIARIETACRKEGGSLDPAKIDGDGLLRVDTTGNRNKTSEEDAILHVGALGSPENSNKMLSPRSEKQEGDGIMRVGASGSPGERRKRESPRSMKPESDGTERIQKYDNPGGTTERKLSHRSLGGSRKGMGSQRSVGATRNGSQRSMNSARIGSQRSMGSKLSGRKGSERSMGGVRKGSQRSMGGQRQGSRRSKGGARKSSLRSLGSTGNMSQRSMVSESDRNSNRSDRSQRSIGFMTDKSDASNEPRLGISRNHSRLSVESSGESDGLSDLILSPGSTASYADDDLSSSHNGSEEVRAWSNNLDCSVASSQDDIETEHLDMEMEELKGFLQEEGIC